MAVPYISKSISFSSSKTEYRQGQARLRVLLQRANTLYGKLSRSSSISDSAFRDIEQAYMAIDDEFQQQRDQFIKRHHHLNQNIQQTRNDMHKSSQLIQKQPANIEVHEIDPLIEDVEYVLRKIIEQLKQYRLKSSHGNGMENKLGILHARNDIESKDISARSLNNIAIYKLHTVDFDISAEWIVASLEGRIFLCNSEGEMRVFSYSRRLHRQPLLSERFYLSIVRLITSFTVTQDYLIAFEIDTQMITLHTHHGALLIRLPFPYEPTMIIRCDYLLKNQFWTCSRTKWQCSEFGINHSTKEIHPIRQLDYKHPIADILIDPLDISSDEQHRLAIHDVNMITSDRLLIYSNNQYTIVPLDFIKYTDQSGSSRIQRILLVPKQSNLIVVVRVPHATTTANLHEILIVDIEVRPPKILCCLTEPNGIQSIDLTLNGELVYTVKPPINKRIASRMYIYSLLD